VKGIELQQYNSTMEAPLQF